MTIYDDARFGEQIAEVHDELYPDVEDAALDVLAELAGGGKEIRLYPVELRYPWPAELDLMAQLAGLSLLHCWASWTKEPFTSDSEKHISVYGW